MPANAPPAVPQIQAAASTANLGPARTSPASAISHRINRYAELGLAFGKIYDNGFVASSFRFGFVFANFGDGGSGFFAVEANSLQLTVFGGGELYPLTLNFSIWTPLLLSNTLTLGARAGAGSASIRAGGESSYEGVLTVGAGIGLHLFEDRRHAITIGADYYNIEASMGVFLIGWRGF